MPTLWQVTTKTLDEAKAEVAAVATTDSGQTAVLDQAEDAIQDAFREWNRFHNWEYTVTLININVTAGDATVNIPADVKQMLDVRMEDGTPRVLHPVDIRNWDRVRSLQSTVGLTRWYSLHSMGQTLEITLLPTPNVTATDALQLKYYRNITIPTVGGTALDLPDHYVDAILDLARAKLLRLRGSRRDLIQDYDILGRSAMRRARAEDLRHPDANTAFIPGVAHSQAGFDERRPETW